MSDLNKQTNTQNNLQSNDENNRKRYILSVVFILALSALWFLFTAKSVVVTTTPMSEKVTINSPGFISYINWQEYLLMRAGEYEIQIELAGHHPIKKKFIVDQRQNQQIHFDFIRLPGTLNLSFEENNSPVENLKALVDGKVVSIKNSVINIAAGEHQIKLTSDNYLPYSTRVNIKGKGQSQVLNIELEPAWANIKVNSSPEGSSVFQADKFLGMTPLTINLLQGEHELSFSKDSYRTTIRDLSVKAGDDKTIATVKLFKQVGRLVISTMPSQVNVTYGSKYLGKTPLNIDVSSDIKQKLLLIKEGYQAVSRELLVPSAQTIHQSFTLAEVVGDIVINASPKDALLYVDGRLMGRANKKLTLAVKQQKIRIEKSGYLSYITTILPLMCCWNLLPQR